eukprot:gnl/TRDRNA2_/TRDRNA2_175992_c0_seq5.p1 gnl/TRDRNA2_/TRDRNA2_175992_c0~~gnl/TRDRNA2_/TRDRNA2_175992_c0_seq5.p1  ORF type:complete len:656 (+),score=108.78 gnl/TRDRNA2_/TRDRNA2_175992_c0_seq5:87-2054(+)
MLRPQQNACRECQHLDGFWEFQAAKDNGRDQGFPSGLPKPRRIGVPSSWNEQYLDLHNHFYEGWYQKRFFINGSWKGRRVFLYFGSVCQNAEVWLNSVRLGSHVGPHLPFEFDVTKSLDFDKENLLIVLADGSLDMEALPPATLSDSDVRAGWGNAYPSVAYDFFPFSGIHRPVVLCSLPGGSSSKEDNEGLRRICDIHVDAQMNDERTAEVSCEVELNGPFVGQVRFAIEGREELETEVHRVCGASKVQARLTLEEPRIWDIGNGQLYTIAVTVESSGHLVDMYRMRFGVRNIEVRGNQFLLNGKPVHFKGFGKHEDFDVIGKGLCHPLIIKDYDLMEWIGANSFRTSHYPYAEEWLDIADERGVLVISENPFVGLGQRLYKQSIIDKALPVVELHMRRDRNHPCVVMWSLANEPNGPENLANGDKDPTEEEKQACLNFYEVLTRKARSLDSTRPLTYAMHMDPESNPMANLFDVLCVNKYFGWYEWTGMIDESLDDMVDHLQKFYDTFRKPIIFAEFGADAVAGVHHLPEVMFSEEYQSKIVERQYTKLLSKPWFLGAHVWNFADFRVGQSITRIIFNRKGVFTRSRQPKLVAHTLKRLWGTARFSGDLGDLKSPPGSPQKELSTLRHELEVKDEEIRKVREELEKMRLSRST